MLIATPESRTPQKVFFHPHDPKYLCGVRDADELRSSRVELAAMKAPHIRPATASDASAAASLSSEWGYPCSEGSMRSRLERMIESPVHLVVVAEVDGSAAGWATGEVRLSLGADPRVEITGLVVAETLRRTGVGRRLIEKIESWAVEKGCHELFLRSNIARPEAHPFYERLGYERTKTQRAYKKVLRAT